MSMSIVDLIMIFLIMYMLGRKVDEIASKME